MTNIKEEKRKPGREAIPFCTKQKTLRLRPSTILALERYRLLLMEETGKSLSISIVVDLLLMDAIETKCNKSL